MSLTVRNPTEIAPCGCPYDPEYDEGSLGWHRLENHVPMVIEGLRGELRSAVGSLDRLEKALRMRTTIYDTEDALAG
jgi:hypothetical protein